jgi:hypothetical protein
MVGCEARKGAGGEATGGIIKCTFRRFRYNITERWMRGVCANTVIHNVPDTCAREWTKEKLNREKKTTEAYFQK